MTPSDRSLTPSSTSSSLSTYSVVFLVSDLVAEVRDTLAPNRWLMVLDLPTPVSPRRINIVWKADRLIECES